MDPNASCRRPDTERSPLALLGLCHVSLDFVLRLKSSLGLLSVTVELLLCDAEILILNTVKVSIEKCAWPVLGNCPQKSCWDFHKVVMSQQLYSHCPQHGLGCKSPCSAWAEIRWAVHSRP